MEPYIKTAVVAIAVLLITAIIWPFITPLVFGALVAYILYPIHQKLKYRFNLKGRLNESISALILTAISVVIVTGIIFYGLQFVLNEFADFYKYFSKLDISSIFEGGDELSEGLNNAFRFLFSKTIGSLSNVVSQLPHILLSVLLFFISVYYFLLDGDKLANWLMQNIPFQKSEGDKIIVRIRKYIHAFVYVWLLIGLGQGIIAGLGFWLFGFEGAVVFGVLAAVLSIVPILGPYVIYVPVGIISILSGDVGAGAGLMIYGLTIGSILDYLVRPYYAGKWSDVHPFTVLLGILGGLLLIGPAGIIAGPIVLFVAISIIKGVRSG